jgi:transcriptional regulator with XRE-family HTH domain
MKTNFIDRYVGARLCSLRESRGLSQERLASALNIPAERLLDLEEGRERIAAELMRSLSRILNAQPAEFFEGFSVTAQGVVRLTDNDARAADEEAQLMRDFALIRDEDARQLILALVSSYAVFAEIAKS